MGIINPSIGRIYKIYSATISQVGLNAPTVTILENDLGNIVWSYSSAGNYLGTLNGAFTLAKTWTIIHAQGQLSATQYVQAALGWNVPPNNVLIQTVVQSFGLGTVVATDGLLTNHPIEIRVYP